MSPEQRLMLEVATEALCKGTYFKSKLGKKWRFHQQY